MSNHIRKVSGFLWKAKADFIWFSSEQTLPPRGERPAKTAWGKTARRDMEPEDGIRWLRSDFLPLPLSSLHMVLHTLSDLSVRT